MPVFKLMNGSSHRWNDAAMEDSGLYPFPSTVECVNVLKRALKTPGMTVITGAPGAGKTETARAFARAYPSRVLYCEGLPAQGPRSYPGQTFLNSIAEVLGVRRMTSWEVVDVIGRELRARQLMLMVDEASLLSGQMLQVVRYLSDSHVRKGLEASIPVVVMGVQRLRSKIARYEEFEHRIVLSYEMRPLTVADLKASMLAEFVDEELIQWVHAVTGGNVGKVISLMRLLEERMQSLGRSPSEIKLNDVLRFRKLREAS